MKKYELYKALLALGYDTTTALKKTVNGRSLFCGCNLFFFTDGGIKYCVDANLKEWAKYDRTTGTYANWRTYAKGVIA